MLRKSTMRTIDGNFRLTRCGYTCWCYYNGDWNITECVSEWQGAPVWQAVRCEPLENRALIPHRHLPDPGRRRSNGNVPDVPSDPGAAWLGANLQRVDAGSGAPDADEQPGPRGRGAAGRAGRVRRGGKGRPELGGVRRHRAHAPRAGERRDAPRAVGEARRRLQDPPLGAAGAH